jgi:predicted O-methyltransferase YrrM
MEWEKVEKNIKGKIRRLHYNQELNLYKRRRTFCGIRCLIHWKILKKHINLNKILNCIEIGSHEGQSATYFLKHILTNKKSTLVCVDPWFKSSWSRTDPSVINYEDIFDLNMDNNDLNNQIIKYTGTNDQYYLLDRFKQKKIDIAYIDDIHTYESTKLNIEMLYPQMKKNGIMIFDDYDGDYCDPNDKNAGHHWTDPVKKAVDEFIKDHRNDIKIIFQEYQIMIQKIK